MKIITLQDLKDKKACAGVVNYFTSLEKDEWELMDLCYQCLNDGKVGYFIWLCEIFQHHFKKSDALGFIKYYNGKGWDISWLCGIFHKHFTKEEILGFIKDYQDGGFETYWLCKTFQNHFTKEDAVGFIEHNIKNNLVICDLCKIFQHLFTKEEILGFRKKAFHFDGLCEIFFGSVDEYEKYIKTTTNL